MAAGHRRGAHRAGRSATRWRRQGPSISRAGADRRLRHACRRWFSACPATPCLTTVRSLGPPGCCGWCFRPAADQRRLLRCRCARWAPPAGWLRTGLEAFLRRRRRRHRGWMMPPLWWLARRRRGRKRLLRTGASTAKAPVTRRPASRPCGWPSASAATAGFSFNSTRCSRSSCGPPPARHGRRRSCAGGAADRRDRRHAGLG